MRMRSFRQAVMDLSACPTAQLRERLEQRLADQPRCPVARYLAGAGCFERRDPATGVRHLMVAYHAEPALESAALLVFAGLNWCSSRQTGLLPVLLETWEEFRRPAFDRYAKERFLLDAFAPAEDPGPLPPLAQRLWRLPISTLRAQLRDAVAGRDAGAYPLLTTASF